MKRNLIFRIILNFARNKGSFYDRVFYIFRDSGILMFKLGQILSTRIDVLPEDLCKKLSSLLDDAPRMDREMVDEIFKNEFGNPPLAVFKDFSYKAIGSASIAQVHKATLMNDQVVAVKIKRPGIDDTLERDIKQLNRLISIASCILPVVRYLKNQNIINQMESWIMQEVSFENEKKNIETIYKEYSYLSQKRFKGLGEPTFIKVFPEYCTGNVIVVEFVEGITISEWVRSGKNDEYDGYTTMKTYLRCAINGLFKKNEYYFQADPHPGNIILQGGANGANIDCGLVIKLDKQEVDVIKSFLLGLYLKDKRRVLQTIKRSSKGIHLKKETKLSRDIDNYMEMLDYEGLGYWFLGMIKIYIKHRISVPKYLIAFGRCMVIIEGTLSMVQPGTRVLDVLEEELQEAALKGMSDIYSKRSVLRAVNHIVQNMISGNIRVRAH